MKSCCIIDNVVSSQGENAAVNRLFKILNGGNNMSTYMPKAGDITRTWYILDAEGQSLGRVAAKAAHILRGKHKIGRAHV